MNIFFLGAGFSKPAGLPLGDELFSEVMRIAKSTGIYEYSLAQSINEYLAYFSAVVGRKITEEEINLEKFMSYLDIDRHLKLHGGDYSGSEEFIKNLIAYVLYSQEQKITTNQFLLYKHFVERLTLGDIIFTFNYDTILEKALREKNVPYRLYSFKNKYDQETGQLLLDGAEEVIIYKMHGAINWFDKTDYQQTKNYWLKAGIERNPSHPIFDESTDLKTRRLLDEPFHQDDPLKNLYVAENLDGYFNYYFKEYKRFSDVAPFLIAPSYHKLLSLDHLGIFWNGFSNVIIGANKIAIIGFSLPEHDEYIRQPMYWYIRNFHKSGEPISGKKSKLKIIDFKQSQQDIEEFKANYRFVDENLTDFYFGGFGKQALDVIFSEE